MVEKFFLALDYPKENVIEKGVNALGFLEEEFSVDFVKDHVGVKLNEDLVTGSIDPLYRLFKTNHSASIFVDKKISHGPDTGGRIVEELLKDLSMDYVTVAASLGQDILKKYVENNNAHGVNTIAFTVHTKISPEDALRIYGRPLNDVIYTLAQMASDAGCDAAVMEAEMLKDERIRELPIKKLVTGIRIDPSDKGTQSRVTALLDLADLKPLVSYAVISSRYLTDPNSLKDIIYALI